MPIYEYELEGGDVIEVYQYNGDTVYTELGEIEADQIITPGFPQVNPDDTTKVARKTSTPGGFRGLPTPKFHRRS
jgi:hypothetical protein